jgi:hypothetical protein
LAEPFFATKTDAADEFELALAGAATGALVVEEAAITDCPSVRSLVSLESEVARFPVVVRRTW